MTKPTEVSEGSAPGEPGALAAPTERTKQRRRRPLATGPLRGRPRPGTVEYEAFRQQSEGGHPYPWRGLDESAERTLECTLRVNDWEYKVFRYVAAIECQSISKLVLRYAMKEALLRVLELEKKGQQP